MTPEILDSIIDNLCNTPDLRFSQRYAIQSLRKERNDLQSQLAAMTAERNDLRLQLQRLGTRPYVPAQVPVDRERYIALREAHGINDSDNYFMARSGIDLGDDRHIFNAGHSRGFDAAAKLYAAPVPAQPVAKVYQCPRCSTSMEVDETAKPVAQSWCTKENTSLKYSDPSAPAGGGKS